MKALRISGLETQEYGLKICKVSVYRKDRNWRNHFSGVSSFLLILSRDDCMTPFTSIYGTGSFLTV